MRSTDLAGLESGEEIVGSLVSVSRAGVGRGGTSGRLSAVVAARSSTRSSCERRDEVDTIAARTIKKHRLECEYAKIGLAGRGDGQGDTD